MTTCLHFGRCGGCRYQDKSQDEQLTMKAAALAELFADHWSEPIEVLPSPEQWFYRNKIEIAFDRAHYDERPPKDFVRPTVVGFRERGKFYATIDIEECRIFSPVMRDFLPELRKWYRDQGLIYFNKRRKTGFLKHVVLRESCRTDDRLLILITADEEFDKQSFADAVTRNCVFTSIYRGIQHGTPDAATADELELLYGKETMREELRIPDGDDTRDLVFEIDPFGFFQVNPPATELLYGYVRERVRELRPGFVYDFYGGSGGIAFSICDLVDDVLSVESFGPASEAGRKNAMLNKIDNVRFETAPVEKFLGLAKNDGSFNADSLAILDPPRSAMHPKALMRIVELGPQDIIYVSCNPKLLARELRVFAERYDLLKLKAFDLFPHTDHVEMVAFLKLR